ncbi:SsgA family sporulation/cell division regulator [Streptomyces sp. NPDC002602]|uniref:SsgA family sporulation/cell division regulator n=1 Tax=Streptomyces sp. NPDC002602 TaxID=3364654 RepID=UPI0036AB74CD
MSVDKDDTMHSTAEDAEFAALMAASSLGAPHVQTCATAIDESTRGHLRAAASGETPPPPNEEGSATGPTSAPGIDASDMADAKDGRPSTIGCAFEAFHREMLGRWQKSAWPYDRSMRVSPKEERLHRSRTIMLVDISRAGTRHDSTAEVRHYLYDLLSDAVRARDEPWSQWRALHKPDRGDGFLLAMPPGVCRTTTYIDLLWEALRRTADSQHLHQQHLVHTAATLSGLPRTEWDKHSRLLPDYLVRFGDESRTQETRHQWWAFGLRRDLGRFALELCKSREESGVQPALLPVSRTATPSNADLARTAVAATVRTASEARLISQACLTDLLHASPPLPWARLALRSTREDQLREARAWTAGRLGDRNRTMWEYSPFGVNEGRDGRELFDAHPQPLPDLATASASLLIASEMAIDLSAARRQPIPTQASTPPDMNAYTLLPGSTLLVPRDERSGAGGKGAMPSPPEPDHWEGERLSEGMGDLHWSRKDKESGERRARLWMRMHLQEGDTGERLPVTLIYKQADRHAITVVFYPGTHDEVSWTFARDLLVDGLNHSVGIGDVIVWPTPASATETSPPQRVHIRLRSPEGTALLSVARPDISAFLEISEPLASSALTETDDGCLTGWERELAELICPHASE